ncbi:hypothetical protein AgCh_023610 [Apium graveolens]
MRMRIWNGNEVNGNENEMETQWDLHQNYYFFFHNRDQGALCIMSGNDIVSAVTLRQTGSSVNSITLEVSTCSLTKVALTIGLVV